MACKQVKYLKGNDVIIGVFITKKHAGELFKMNPALICSEHYVRFLELARASRGMDLTLYFFTDNQVDFEKKHVKGLYYSFTQNTWKPGTFPLPHVLYDRGGGILNSSKRIIRKFRELGIENINGRHFFDKWDLYNRLSKLEAMQPHLPYTVRGEKGHDVVKALHGYGQVYVKARRGSCGTGVIRIEKHGPGRFRYYYSYGTTLYSSIVTGQELIWMIDQYFAHHPFIIQKPIDLIKKGESIIDFRSEVQKDERGHIFVFGTTARIGRPHSPIASNTRKESYYPFDTFVNKFMILHGLKASEVEEKVNRFLLTVFSSVEKAYGSFGEMGIDFGIDPSGHLWLIECNSKSAKVALFHAFGENKVRQSFRNLLQYARSQVNRKHKLPGEAHK